MNAIQIIKHTNDFGVHSFVFKIRIKNGFAYMTLNKRFLRNANLGDSDEQIIIIDSNKFLELWKNDPRNSERYLAIGNEAVWRKDYKFHHAEEGFSLGISNPVPLAYVHCYLTDFNESFATKIFNSVIVKKNMIKKRPYCAFTNGITRTIWLLANGAECFPVITDRGGYDLFQFHAGISESDELFKNIEGLL
ncbi:MAG: hypothetical protein H0T84_13585 [Tatlockia sp.]|nr:hypothetical protein [Tatlockia sp.]